VEQINAAVSQMDKITQANAAGAEESAAAAEQLKAQSMALQDAVTELSKMVGRGTESGLGPTDTTEQTPSQFSISHIPIPAARGAKSTHSVVAR
jgi:hypothetical protein